MDSKLKCIAHTREDNSIRAVTRKPHDAADISYTQWSLGLVASGSERSSPIAIQFINSHLTSDTRSHDCAIYSIDVKNVFYVFLFLLRFQRFLFCQRFLFFKNVHCKFHNGLQKALLKPQKRSNRPRFYHESDWMHSSSVPITELIICSAYSDTADVTSCSRRSQYEKSWIATNWIKFSVLSYSYTAPTALGIKVEQIRANVFYSTFLNVFYFVHVFNVFYFF